MDPVGPDERPDLMRELLEQLFPRLHDTNGSWTSKLGTLEDIAHFDVAGVSETDYGRVVAFLQRRKPSSV
jgi:hypothetical protein